MTLAALLRFTTNSATQADIAGSLSECSCCALLPLAVCPLPGQCSCRGSQLACAPGCYLQRYAEPNHTITEVWH